MPIDRLFCPQDFAEQLFAKLKTCSFKIEAKILMMKTLARIIGRHKLLLLNFYVFIKRYMMPH